MKENNIFGPCIRRFLREHLVDERNLAHNTQASYRDALTLLLPFAADKAHKAIDHLCVDDISGEVVRLFLQHLEEKRECSVSTRNQRLAAIHALARFIGENSPEHVAWCREIRSIPFKKTAKPAMNYLDKPEMDALLNTPNRLTIQGAHDYALLLFLYNTGARANEAAHVSVADLCLDGSPSVKLVGKAHKVCRCPLWQLTTNVLRPLVAGRAPEEKLFLNRRRQPMTRFGIHALVKRSVFRAACQTSSLRTKRISAHSIRYVLSSNYVLSSGLFLPIFYSCFFL